MDRHRFWPFFKRRVSNEGRYGHSSPHRTPVNIRIICSIRLASRKYHLKAQTPAGHGSDSYRHSVKKFTVILQMIAGVFSPHPALEMRYVTLKIRQFTLPCRLLSNPSFSSCRHRPSFGLYRLWRSLFSSSCRHRPSFGLYRL